MLAVRLQMKPPPVAQMPKRTQVFNGAAPKLAVCTKCTTCLVGPRSKKALSCITKHRTLAAKMLKTLN